MSEKNLNELLNNIADLYDSSYTLSSFTGSTRQEAIKYLEEIRESAMQSVFGLVDGH